jgi:HK97 family phage prohead protease
MKFETRDNFHKGKKGALLAHGGLARGALTSKDAVIDYLIEDGLDEDAIEKTLEDLKADSGEIRAFPFVLSTASVDRHGDTIDQKGWELDNYRKNPVVLWGHDHDQLPVGRAASVYVTPDGSKLKAIDRFSDATELARSVKQLYQEGFLNAVSVGFMPKEYELAEDEERGFMAADFKTQELLEHSAVGVPAHPEALLEARSIGIDLAPIREFYEKALDEGGYLSVPRRHLEACAKAANGRKVFVDIGGNAMTDAAVIREASLEDLKAELAERGFSATPKVDVEAIIRDELAKTRAAAFEDVRKKLSSIKTRMTGKID